MKQYIGTKIIEAEPAYRCMDGQGHITITGDPSEAFPNFPSVEDGYRVQYADGYVSWSPKDTFERAYEKARPVLPGYGRRAGPGPA